jgi:hypothetical protein
MGQEKGEHKPNLLDGLNELTRSSKATKRTRSQNWLDQP